MRGYLRQQCRVTLFCLHDWGQCRTAEGSNIANVELLTGTAIRPEASDGRDSYPWTRRQPSVKALARRELGCTRPCGLRRTMRWSRPMDLTRQSTSHNQRHLPPRCGFPSPLRIPNRGRMPISIRQHTLSIGPSIPQDSVLHLQAPRRTKRGLLLPSLTYVCTVRNS